MAGILSFEVTGTDAVKQGLAAFDAAISDLRPFWKEVFAPKYFAIVQDLFATGGRNRGGGGRFKGGAWAPLSPKYRIWKNLNYPGRPILVREGTLQESLRWHGGLGAGGVFQAFPTYAIAGTNIPYAKFHNEGTKNMPMRQLLPPPDPAVFAPLLKEWLMKSKKA